ncbi:MAG: hypothetical protein ACYDEV_07210 [Acidiferrobacter sp.]
MSPVRPLEKPEDLSQLSNVDLAQAINTSLSGVKRASGGFKGAHARAAGHYYVSVRYHRSQEPFYLSSEGARRYLMWIDAGHVGPHWVMEG